MLNLSAILTTTVNLKILTSQSIVMFWLLRILVHQWIYASHMVGVVGACHRQHILSCSFRHEQSHHCKNSKVTIKTHCICISGWGIMLQSILILTVCTVNSHPFLFGCRRDFRMTAIMMMTAIMVMPTSTQLARTEPTTMTIEILFDDEPCSEIQTHNLCAS